MAFYYHKDKSLYFQHQYENTREYVQPFTGLEKGWHILDIGCGEGGVLKAYTDLGCTGVGVELSPFKYENAVKFLQEEVEGGRIAIYCEDIYSNVFLDQFKGAFDLIILKDVIEHIHDQPRLMSRMKSFLKPDGKIFLGFPPWQMPFGGHQQVCESKVLSKFPYFHLLPKRMYTFILKSFGESEKTINGLIEIKETGLSIEQFEQYVKKTNYDVFKKLYYLINPIYRFKFGLKPRIQTPWLSKIPVIRNYFTTCVYYMISNKK